MDTPAIRLARDTDAQPIAVMSRCLIELGLRGWSWNPARVAKAIRHRDACVIVAGDGQQISGFAIAEFGDTRMHLSLLAVTAERQRRGIGQALVRWLEKSALTAGITEIQLELRANNPGAKFFYQALGFAFVNAVPRYYRGEETAFKMRKAISSVTASAIKS
ncbi:MAG: GNAT family N-acetyltransferase [Burkholderiales bacterium]